MIAFSKKSLLAWSIEIEFERFEVNMKLLRKKVLCKLIEILSFEANDRNREDLICKLYQGVWEEIRVLKKGKLTWGSSKRTWNSSLGIGEGVIRTLITVFEPIDFLLVDDNDLLPSKLFDSTCLGTSRRKLTKTTWWLGRWRPESFSSSAVMIWLFRTWMETLDEAESVLRLWNSSFWWRRRLEVAAASSSDSWRPPPPSRLPTSSLLL